MNALLDVRRFLLVGFIKKNCSFKKCHYSFIFFPFISYNTLPSLLLFKFCVAFAVLYQINKNGMAYIRKCYYKNDKKNTQSCAIDILWVFISYEMKEFTVLSLNYRFYYIRQTRANYIITNFIIILSKSYFFNIQHENVLRIFLKCLEKCMDCIYFKIIV